MTKIELKNEISTVKNLHSTLKKEENQKKFDENNLEASEELECSQRRRDAKKALKLAIK